MATVVKFTNPVLLDYFHQHPETIASDITDEAMRSYSGGQKIERKPWGRPRKRRNELCVKISPANAKWLTDNRRKNGEMKTHAAERIVMEFLGLHDREEA